MNSMGSPFPNLPARCAELSKPSIVQFMISCLLMIWLLAANIPQWARIISRRSAEGLSTLYILLGSLSGVCAVGNILVLPSTDEDIECCLQNSTFSCISGLLGMLQVISGIACFWVVLFLYVYYSEDEAEAEIHGRRQSVAGPETTFRKARSAWIVLLVVCCFAFTILIISAVIVRRFPWVAQTWADILGILVALLACVQWLPQVYTTWSLGHLGSLSLASLSLSAPYSWIFGISMMAREGPAGWSAWIVYLLVGLMQAFLISLGVAYHVKAWREPPPAPERPERPSNRLNLQFSGWNTSRQSMASSHIAPDEQRPLLGSRPSGSNHA
ncbi:hypothetical protein S40285_09292 [Stachybotrys chlorohalonatus IBT 40285]|uniref:PQ loop repeat protein n=1 Tax=Stachybotrys chlorohalonatus (strain IBT 40285) TaxID=1283841 RepID=A0A084Q7Z9_STAC4|nr:hypothetical protein S40285_09292 [Stachybotrys chlorohalonata IBT 40285]